MDEQPSNQALPTEGWEFSKGVGALSLIESTFDCCSPGGTRVDPAFAQCSAKVNNLRNGLRFVSMWTHILYPLLFPLPQCPLVGLLFTLIMSTFID